MWRGHMHSIDARKNTENRAKNHRYCSWFVLKGSLLSESSSEDRILPSWSANTVGEQQHPQCHQQRFRKPGSIPAIWGPEAEAFIHPKLFYFSASEGLKLVFGCSAFICKSWDVWKCELWIHIRTPSDLSNITTKVPMNAPLILISPDKTYCLHFMPSSNE